MSGPFTQAAALLAIQWSLAAYLWSDRWWWMTEGDLWFAIYVVWLFRVIGPLYTLVILSLPLGRWWRVGSLLTLCLSQVFIWPFRVYHLPPHEWSVRDWLLGYHGPRYLVIAGPIEYATLVLVVLSVPLVVSSLSIRRAEADGMPER